MAIKVTLLMAITLDGKIAQDSDHFPDWTGPEDKKFFQQKTQESGVIIMGSKTFDTIGRPLPKRRNIILTRNKDRKSEWENLVFTDQSPKKILADLEQAGFKSVILCGGTEINTLFARENLIDECLITVSPKIFGSGLGIFSDEIALDLALIAVKKLSEQVLLLEYKVKKPA